MTTLVQLKPTSCGLPAVRRSGLGGHVSGRGSVLSLAPTGKPPGEGTKPAPDVRNDDAGLHTLNASLSAIEVEAMLRQRVRQCHKEQLVQAFQQYDASRALSITKGEFRQALESLGVTLSTPQFDAVVSKVDTNARGMVLYGDFLAKFHGGFEINGDKRKSGCDRLPGQDEAQSDMNVDTFEKILREKLQSRAKEVIKALHFYDCNRDGHITRHEFRKVLEASGLKLTDKLFDKLYQRYDFQRRGVINYKEFLHRLGFSVDRHSRPDDLKAKTSPQPPKLIDGIELSKLNLDHIDALFRNKMRSNYVYLKKMFIAFDRKSDGFITIDDLRSALTQFALPMSDDTFALIMDRAGIKATGKLSWEAFLEKFQNPQNNYNGQTIPIKPGHKVFPQRGGKQPISCGEVILLLREHVAAAYPSLKEAFLRIDKNRDGKISRAELRRVIDRFRFELSDEHFKDLMACLDPQRTNCISYQHFLKLFEHKDAPTSHKWLFGERKIKESNKPAILAWETVEEILRTKLAANWKAVSKSIVKYDKHGSGLLKTGQLRRLIEQICLPLSTEHYQSLLDRFGGSAPEGSVDYARLLHGLGVVVQPGDLDGVSTQIMKGSSEEQARRDGDQLARQRELKESLAARINTMSADEVICRLKDRIAQHSVHFRDAFTSCDKRGAGKLTRGDFRKVLAGIEMELTDAQFSELCSRLQFVSGHMTYAQFVENFEDPRLGGSTETLHKVSNHRVNAIRGDEYGLDADTVERKLSNKLRDNFQSLRGAFYKFDVDHRGALTRDDFRRMLDAFMMTMSDAQFDKLCARLGIERRSRITYLDFLSRFEVKETEEGHKWLDSDVRAVVEPPGKTMTAEEVHSILGMKAHGRWTHLAEAFRSLSTRGCSMISRKELRQTLKRFSLFMSKDEFQRLWSCYDREGKGYVSYADFQSRLTNSEFGPGDTSGISRRIVEGSQRALELHYRGQQERQQDITLRQTNAAESGLTASAVLQQLRDRFRDQYDDFYTAFRAFDEQHKGYLSVGDVQNMLIKCSYYLNNEQIAELLARLGMSQPGGQLTYELFLTAFEEGQKASYPRVCPPKVKYPSDQATQQLTTETATSHMTDWIGANTELIQNACQAFDNDDSGYIRLDDLKRVLDNFAFKMTAVQFNYFAKNRLETSSDGMVNYKALFDEFKDVQLLLVSAPDTPSSARDDEPPSLAQLQRRLTEAVGPRFHHLSRTFARLDYAKLGVLSRSDFRDIFTKHVLRVDNEQFDSIWSTLSVNEFGNVDYRDFLVKYTSANRNGFDTSRSMGGNGRFGTFPPGGATSRLSNRPHSALSQCGEARRPFTPLVDAQSAERRVQKQVCRNWKHIQRLCRMYDLQNTGAIAQRHMREILLSQQMSLCADDIEKMMTKYDLHNDDTFCYSEFIRHIVLDTDRRPKLGRSQTTLQGSGIQEETEEAVVGETTACARVRACVVQHWREMRRALRAADTGATGVVPADTLRQTLRRHNINLSEEDFSEVLAACGDTGGDGGDTGGGSVNYNAFIKRFLVHR